MNVKQYSMLFLEEKIESWHCFPHNAKLTLLHSRQNLKQMSSIFANGPGDQGSILGRVIPKIKKMVHDAALLKTQHYKVRIKGEVEQSREWSSTLFYTEV